MSHTDDIIKGRVHQKI